jgi:hypothetical protein
MVATNFASADGGPSPELPRVDEGDLGLRPVVRPEGPREAVYPTAPAISI